MKKGIVLAIILALSVTMLAGCGTNETVATGIIYDPMDYITLGDYSKIEIAVASPVVTDEQIDAEIETLQTSNTTYEDITDRTAMIGDQTNIGFVGTLDGVAFEGGTSDEAGFDLLLGSGSMVEGFEEGIVGMEVGEEKVIDVTFPEDYYEDLAGKDVQFTITLNSLQMPIVPELTDEFIASVNESCANLEELRTYYNDQLMATAQNDYTNSTMQAAFTVVYDASVFKDELPEGLQDTYVEESIATNNGYAESLGIDLATLITSYYGMTEEEFYTLIDEDAAEYARLEILIRAIAQQEGISATDEEIQTFAEENYAYYGLTSVEELFAQISEDRIALLVESDKVITLIMENTVVTEP